MQPLHVELLTLTLSYTTPQTFSSNQHNHRPWRLVNHSHPVVHAWISHQRADGVVSARSSHMDAIFSCDLLCTIPILAVLFHLVLMMALVSFLWYNLTI
jgi:hypothetical protein